MKLAELQGAYRAYLLSGDAAPLAPVIVEDAFDAGERLAIYRNNFLISLTEALKANFPVTRQLLGEDFFAEAAARFVRAHPPRQPCLFEYGETFPGYLHALPQLAELTYVAEVARFEFARICAYHAARERTLTAPQLARLRRPNDWKACRSALRTMPKCSRATRPCWRCGPRINPRSRTSPAST